MNNNLGRFRLSVTSDTNAVADPLPARVREILSIPTAKRSPAQIAAVFSYWRTTVPDFKEANEQIDKLWSEWPAGSTALTLMAREEQRETHVLKRETGSSLLTPSARAFPPFCTRCPLALRPRG